MPTCQPPSNSQYSVCTSYQGPDDPNTQQTWLLPPAYVYGKATPQSPLVLPFLWTGTGNANDIAFSNDDFVLTVTYSGSPTVGNVSVRLQLTGKNAWNTKPGSRATLRTNYLNFVAGVEKSLEIGPPALLIPGSTAFIASSLVQYMPLPLSEVLLYGCGLETGIGTGAPAAVDVMAGMRLRTEPAVRQYVAPPNQSFSGYVSAGALEWVVSTNVSSGTAVQSFDPFLGTIAAPQVTPPSLGPVYGLIDLQLTGAAFKYYRLIYPQNVIAGGAVGSGGAATNVQITGANTLADLRGNPAYRTSFFGRDIVIPEIAILFQLGNNFPPQLLYVPVGTTLTNLLERFTRWLPLATGQNVLNLKRLVLASPSSGTQGAQTYSQVVFQQANALSYNDLRAFPVPLLPGDYVSIALGP